MATNIGTRIMERRQQLGWTQADLAFKMGYKTKSAINKIELGINDVSQSKVVKFAEVLRTSVAYLMDWEEDIQQDPVGMAERHIEILMDEDITGIFEEFKTLDSTQKQLVKDLIHNLAETKKVDA